MCSSYCGPGGGEPYNIILLILLFSPNSTESYTVYSQVTAAELDGSSGELSASLIGGSGENEKHFSAKAAAVGYGEGQSTSSSLYICVTGRVVYIIISLSLTVMCQACDRWY